MFSLSTYAITLFAVLSTLVAAGDDAWHLDYTYVLANEMLDPIVNPNAQSGHMHKIIGGSRFGASYNYADYNGASCSSLAVQADKSNYWMPNLYQIDPNGKYQQVPTFIRFYYFLSRSSPNELVKPFPPGLRMLAGSPENKSPTKYGSFYCQVNPDFSNTIQADNFNFNTDCGYGMKTEVFFPQCWDGVNLYKSDQSHMSYPVGNSANVRDGSCPVSHPIRLPTIQLEYTWKTQLTNPGTPLNGTLFWSNGDTTGYGIHADFVNGWDIDVLGAALNSSACNIGSGQAMPMENCPILNAHFDYTAAANCQPEKGIAQNPQGNADSVPLDTIPGCANAWGQGPKPACVPAWNTLDVSAQSGTDGPYIANPIQNYTIDNTPGWKTAYCIQNQQSIQGQVSYKDTSMTVDKCQASCVTGGYNWAAIGQVGAGNWQCICGTGLDTSAPLQPQMCTVACPGNSNQTCGGSPYIFQTYYAGPGTVANTSTPMTNGASYVGCYDRTSSDGLIGKSNYNFGSTAMTTEVCTSACVQRNATWAATVNGKTCYCGNNYTPAPGTYLPSSMCTVKCNGNSSEICGDIYKASVYNISTAGATVSDGKHVAGYIGCFNDNSNTRIGLTATNWVATDMDQPDCVNGCSELGYKYAGLELGNRCYCGNTYTTTAQQLPTSQCSMACAGNSSQTCGAQYNMDVYSTASATVTKTGDAASRPAGFMGCYQDASTTTFKNQYSYTISSGMTVDFCKTSCMQLGYSYAGLEAGWQCNCGAGGPQTQAYPTAQYCTTKCNGNNTSTCGGTGYQEVYTLAGYTAPNVKSGNGTSAASYMGCHDNTQGGLNGTKITNNALTVELCRSACASNGYAVAGMSNSNICQCGNAWMNGDIRPDNLCSNKCPGNSSEYCGGQGYASVYNATSAGSATTHPKGWFSCWSDPTSSRALTGYNFVGSTMNAATCMSVCKNKGYALAGTEYGTQCYCGNTLSGGAAAASIYCSKPCAGSTNGETCGGPYYMDVYNVSSPTATSSSSASASSAAPTAKSTYASNSTGFIGCYSDFTDGKTRTLTGYTFTSGAMTQDLCTSTCKSKGFALAGSEYKTQCFCGNNITSTATLSSPTSCNAPCGGGGQYACGGSYLISIFDVGKYAAPPAQASTSASASASVSKSASGSTSASATASPSASSTPLPEGMQGCYGTGSFFSSPGFYYTSTAMTTGLCRRTCRSMQYQYAGLMGGNTCACGNTANWGASSPSTCTTTCTGQTGTTCGGSASGAIFDTTGPGSLTPTGFPANYVGCYVDSSTARVLPNVSFTSNSMNSAFAQSYCAQRKYTWWGTEYGTQGFCGSTMPKMGMMPDSQCSSKCAAAGSTNEMCGGSYRVSVYWYVDSDGSSQVGAAAVAASSSSSSSAAAVSSTTQAAATSSTASATTSKAPASTSPAAQATTSSAAAASKAATISSPAAASSAAASSKAKRDAMVMRRLNMVAQKQARGQGSLLRK